MKIKGFSSLIPVLACTSVVAGPLPEGDWKSSAELGLVATGGNTETTSIQARATVSLDTGTWLHSLTADALNTSDESGTTTERYFAGLKSEYKLSEKGFLYVKVDYEDDRFAGFDYRLSESLGFGRTFIENDTWLLKAEVGPGARQTRYNDNSSDSELTLHTAGSLGWQLSESSRFTQDLSIDLGSDNTVSEAVSAITSNIAGNLAMKASFRIKHNSEVPADTKKTDTQLAMTLVYTF